MPRHIRLVLHLTHDELRDRYRRTHDPVERSHWRVLWLLAGGVTATAVAAVTSYSAYWIGQIARSCVALPGRPDLTCWRTRFSWWQQRMHRRHDPRRS